ncbi:hypothetical protein OBJ95_09685 [Empedobacter falsenii]|uniref:DUF6929 family protein n=1 Tax=Empedobacter stercoris TaxID=1628248 RepID=UPI001CE0F69C|nr:hypothetical protein [Empedobacter stercoris]MCA4776074.1 hypothetical protein [Empedobacter stercoris]MCA4782753.1 hypothetical protein [Empedobacter stercoris]
MLFYHFILKILIVINGLGAASGLVVDKRYVYTISDDNPHLFVYDKKKKEVEKINLNPEVKSEGSHKKDKPDFEAITKYKDHLYILGSGSKENRFDLISYNLKTKQVENKTYRDLFEKFLSVSKLSKKDFNIEGIITDGHCTYFFNRGNGPAAANGIYRVGGALNDLKNKPIDYFPITLPKLNNEITTFSDAIMVDGKILFTATVESKSTTQFNGEIKGSIIGELDLAIMEVTRWQKISDDKKIEGLALYKESRKNYTLYLCEDNDDDSKNASIYIYKYQKEL